MVIVPGLVGHIYSFIIQVVGVSQASSNEMGREMLYLGANLKVKSTRFPHRLGVEYENKKEIRGEDKVFGLSNWKDGDAIILVVQLLENPVWEG